MQWLAHGLVRVPRGVMLTRAVPTPRITRCHMRVHKGICASRKAPCSVTGLVTNADREATGLEGLDRPSFLPRPDVTWICAAFGDLGSACFPLLVRVTVRMIINPGVL